VITVAPTGPIASKADNPALPTQPDEIAEAVHQAYLAGASVAHIHLRDSNDRPTADLTTARRTMDLIAERCPILIQMSTGVGLSVPFTEREALVELRPRMATLNPCTIGRANLELTAIGLALGGNARAGLEDTLYLRKGEQSAGNLPLVQRAMALAAALDRPAASVDETAALLRLPTR
jgi:uncharacterized protein (DUF849 family)